MPLQDKNGESITDLLTRWTIPPYPDSVDDNIEAIDNMIEKILAYLVEKEDKITQLERRVEELDNRTMGSRKFTV